MRALESKFMYKLNELKQDMEEKINQMRRNNRTYFAQAETRLRALEDAIDTEVNDRVKESDEHIYATKDELTAL